MSSASSKYFDAPAEAPEHPRIRAWRASKNSAQRVELEIWRPREGIAFRSPRMFVTFYRAGDDARLDEADWELELDTWLLKEHVKAKNVDNEKLRFTLRLKAAFRPIAVRFGDGYFNSVLVYLLRSNFAGREPLTQVLSSISEYEAGGGSKQDCEELIDYEIGVIARALMSLYDNDRTLAEDILIGALAQYMDERFHVTERRELGLG
jgi:hypothetical protein